MGSDRQGDVPACHWALRYGVTVLTTPPRGRGLGATASAVSSLSLEPPMLLVCLHMRSNTKRLSTRAVGSA